MENNQAEITEDIITSSKDLAPPMSKAIAIWIWEKSEKYCNFILRNGRD